MKPIIRSCGHLFLTMMLLATATANAGLLGADAPFTVAAYYYPGTHPDPRWDKNKYPGFTEWDEIKAAKPRFPGHIQPKPPVWGYQNEAQPEVMAQKIAA